MRIAALVAALVAAATLRAGAAPDPYSIYQNAQAFWLSQRYPAYLAYDVAVQVVQGGVVRIERYQSSFDATDGSIWVDAVSDYEHAHPYVPPGGLNFFIQTHQIGKPEEPIDFIGVPILAPTYTFGMAPFIAQAPPSQQSDAQIVGEVRAAFHDPYPVGRTPPPAPPDALPQIAHLIVARRIYTISLIGEESVEGHQCYHLTLRPLHDPGRYRLRDLWIDERSGATWRLQEALNFVDGPGTTVAWTVSFANEDGVQYIAQESANAPVRYEHLTYANVVVSFENVHAVTLPALHPIYISPQTATLREPQ